MHSNKSKERANQILRIHLDTLEREAKPILLSVVLVGSLSNGSYTADSGSDIDLIHILRDDAPQESRRVILDLIARTEQSTGRDIPISRCVYRYKDLFRPYPADFPFCLENKDYIELPIEIMRMKDSGRTLWGQDILGTIDYPRREDVIAGKNQERRCSKQVQEETGFRPIAPEKLPVRLIVQSVLVRGLLDYFFATGTSCSNKAEVAEKLHRDVPDYAFLELVTLCTKWRYQSKKFTSDDERRLIALWPQWIERRKGVGVDVVVKSDTDNIIET